MYISVNTPQDVCHLDGKCNSVFLSDRMCLRWGSEWAHGLARWCRMCSVEPEELSPQARLSQGSRGEKGVRADLRLRDLPMPSSSAGYAALLPWRPWGRVGPERALLESCLSSTVPVTRRARFQRLTLCTGISGAQPGTSDTSTERIAGDQRYFHMWASRCGW